ncbi:MFS transporter [Kitasatospora sp. NPDC059327]|uniref:MFS transporter n=1 Tax=Kitasatospora sp. NPDC059327 TaxID=3346803 RepID=UPI0036850E9A
MKSAENNAVGGAVPPTGRNDRRSVGAGSVGARSAGEASVGAGAGAGAGSGAIVAALAFAGITVAVMQTIVIPIIPALPGLLHTSASNASWALTATLLAGAVATPVSGRLGDLFGKRRMLLASLVLMIVGSVVAALGSSLVPVVVGRALQGAAAGVIPLGISIMRDVLPRERLGSAMGLMSSSLGIGGALGLPAAAVVAQRADWHWLFWGSAGLGVLAAALVLTIVPESPDRTGGRFDAIGAAGLSAGLVCLLLAISKGGDWGWLSGLTLGLFAAAVLILLLWGLFELRSDQPLVDLRATARRQVLLTNGASVALGFAMYAQSLALPQLLQLPEATGYGLGRSMVVAGLCMAPGGLIMMLVSPFSAKLSAAKGPRTSLLVGAVVLAVGYLLGLVLLHEVWQLVLVGCILGTGIAFAYAAIPALIMGAVPPGETAAANGFNALMRSIGTSFASAVIGAVLAHTAVSFGPAQVPSLGGFRATFAIGAGAAALGVLIIAFIPRRRREVAPVPLVVLPGGAGDAVDGAVGGGVGGGDGVSDRVDGAVGGAGRAEVAPGGEPRGGAEAGARV